MTDWLDKAWEHSPVLAFFLTVVLLFLGFLKGERADRRAAISAFIDAQDKAAKNCHNVHERLIDESIEARAQDREVIQKNTEVLGEVKNQLAECRKNKQCFPGSGL